MAVDELSDEVRTLAYQYALEMPDEYPYGFAIYMAKHTLGLIGDEGEDLSFSPED